MTYESQKFNRRDYTAWLSANKEIYVVAFPDGRRGQGWEEIDAVCNAVRSFEQGRKIYQQNSAQN